MRTTKTLTLCSILLAACGGKPDLSPDAKEAMALLAEIQRHTGIDLAALDGGTPRAMPPRPVDTFDPSRLLTEADVVAALRAQDVHQSSPTAVLRAELRRIERPENAGSGTSVLACRVDWSMTEPGGTFGASGNFVLAALDVATFRFFAAQTHTKSVPDLGDEAFSYLGVPYARVGEIALTIENTTGTEALSVGLLRAAALRLRS